MREHPPQILLTNYMMLELLLTRLRERPIRDGIYENLRFLVFDELHTYRGRQGADVAMLIRRIRAQCGQSVVCIGTSATMVSVGSLADSEPRWPRWRRRCSASSSRPTRLSTRPWTVLSTIPRPAPTQAMSLPARLQRGSILMTTLTKLKTTRWQCGWKTR